MGFSFLITPKYIHVELTRQNGLEINGKKITISDTTWTKQKLKQITGCSH